MDHGERLRWARHHLDALEADLERFSNSRPYQIAVRTDPDLPQYAAYLSEVKAPEPDWSLRIGDVLHSARSALDNLVYQRSVAFTGRELSKDERRPVLFPVVLEQKDWSSTANLRLPFVAPAVAAVIEGVQPYHLLETKSPLAHQQLALLRDGSNEDKHRKVLLLLTAPTGFRIGFRGPSVPPLTIASHGYRGPFERGAYVGGWTYDGPSLFTDPDVEVYAEATLTIQGTQGSVFEGVVIPRYLRSLLGFIEKRIIEPIEALP